MRLNFSNTSTEEDLRIKLVKKTGTIDASETTNTTVGTTGDTTTFCLSKKVAGAGAPTAIFNWAFNLDSPGVNDSITQQFVVIDGAEYPLFGFIQNTIDQDPLPVVVKSEAMAADPLPSDGPAGYTPYILITIENKSMTTDVSIGAKSGHVDAYIYPREGVNPSIVTISPGMDYEGTLTPTTTPPNKKPVVEDYPEFNVTEDTLYQGQIIATDPDGDTLSYSIVGQPYDNNPVTIDQTGVFLFKPKWLSGVNSVTDYFKVRVSDGKDFVVKTVNFRIVLKEPVSEVTDMGILKVKKLVPNKQYNVYASLTYNEIVAIATTNDDGDLNTQLIGMDIYGAPTSTSLELEVSGRYNVTLPYVFKGIQFINQNNNLKNVQPWIKVSANEAGKVKVRYWDNIIKEYTISESGSFDIPLPGTITKDPNSDQISLANGNTYLPFVQISSDVDITIRTNAQSVNRQETNTSTKYQYSFAPNRLNVVSQLYFEYSSSEFIADRAKGYGWKFGQARSNNGGRGTGVYSSGTPAPYTDPRVMFIDGTNRGWLKSDDNVLLDSTVAFTVEFFINVVSKADAINGGSSTINCHIFNNNLFRLVANGSNIDEWAIIGNNGGTNKEMISTGITADTWHHVAMMNDVGTNRIYLMVDGVQVDYGSIAGVTSGVPTMGLNYNSSGDVIDINAAQLNFGINSFRIVNGFNMYPIEGFVPPTTKLPLPEDIGDVVTVG